MKTRFQLAGVEYGSTDRVFWSGEMPMLSGVPGMRISILRKDGSVDALSVKQVAFEVDERQPGHCEQVLYVRPVDASKARLLMEEGNVREAEGSGQTA